MMKLPERQRDLLVFIENYLEERGWPPTIAEIADNFGWRSPVSVTQKLQALQKKGFVRLHPRVARGIELLRPAPRGADRESPADRLRIPVVGSVAAGLPTEAPQNIEHWLNPDDLGEFFGGGVLRREGLFVLQVRGESMIDAGILEGDFLLVRETPEAAEGQIVVALVDGETTVKRLMYNGIEIHLQPVHPYMQDIVIGPERQIEVQGILVGVIRKVS